MNTKPNVLVLGATGQIGKLIIEQLKTENSLMVRSTSRKQEHLGDLSKQHGDVVYLDLDDPTTFSKALQGVKRLFLLTGYTVAMLAQSKTLIDAAIKAGIEHVVHLGVFSCEWDCTDPHFLWHQMIEVYIKQSGMKWTFLHPNCFMQNLINFSLIHEGKFRWYAENKPCGWIALEDVAQVTVKILVEGPNYHHGRDYWFSTEVLTSDEIVQILTEVTGYPFITDNQPPEQFLKDLGSEIKTLDPYFYSVAESFRQIIDGRMSYIGEVRDDVKILLGRKGLTFRQWVEKHQAMFAQLAFQKTTSNAIWGKS